MKRLFTSCMLAIATLVAGIATEDATRAAAPYSQTWSGVTTEGWGANTTSSVVVHDASMGNPAGSLVTRRDLSPPLFAIGATSGSVAELQGNFSGSPWNVKFDVLQDLGKVDQLSLRFRYKDATFNGWRFPFPGPFEEFNVWKTYSVNFDPSWTDAQAMANGWVQEGAPVVGFTQTLGDVFYTEIRLELTAATSSAAAHIDNFVLRQVPEPGSLTAVWGLLGLAAWRRSRSFVR